MLNVMPNGNFIVKQIYLFQNQQENLLNILAEQKHADAPVAQNHTLQAEIQLVHLIYLQVIEERASMVLQHQEITKKFFALISQAQLTDKSLLNAFELWAAQIDSMQKEFHRNGESYIKLDVYMTLLSNNNPPSATDRKAFWDWAQERFEIPPASLFSIRAKFSGIQEAKSQD